MGDCQSSAWRPAGSASDVDPPTRQWPDRGDAQAILGGEEGATLVDAMVVGEELQATAVVGAPRPAGASVRRGPPNWKENVGVTLVLKNDGVTLKGRADVTLGEVPWLAFRYELSKKRSRY